MRFYILILFLIAFIVAPNANAQKLPAEVMEPYRSYRVAIKDGNEKQAIKYAKQAWLAAEKHLGDHVTTGDLASNYALTDNENWNRDRQRAYELAVTLAELHEDAGKRSIERQVQYIEAFASNEVGKPGEFLAKINDGFSILDKYELRGSTFEGELYILRGVHRTRRGADKSALEDIEKGLEIIENAEDDLISAYPYMGKLYRADVLRNDNKDLDAALAYQEVMQNVEGVLPADHPYVSKAFSNWMSLRFEFEQDGTLEDAEQAGLCECWPYENYKSKAYPMKRIPPKMPRAANGSGYVQVLFDVTDEGKTKNIRVLDSSHTLFERPAIQSVEKWIYTERSEEEDEGSRSDVTSRVTFVLMDGRGNVLPNH